MNTKEEKILYETLEVQKFLEEAESVVMSSTEKRNLWIAISRRMEANEKKVVSPYSFSFMFKHRKQIIAFASIVLILTGYFGTSYAADSSLPGDALYSVKINVNEEVQNFFAIGANAQAKVAVDQAKKRLQEAETLSVKGRLNSNTKAIIEANFKKHTTKIKESVATLHSEKNTQAANAVISDLTYSVKAHETILSSIKERTGSTTQNQIDSLIGNINTQVVADLASTSVGATSTSIDLSEVLKNDASSTDATTIIVATSSTSTIGVKNTSVLTATTTMSLSTSTKNKATSTSTSTTTQPVASTTITASDIDQTQKDAINVIDQASQSTKDSSNNSILSDKAAEKFQLAQDEIKNARTYLDSKQYEKALNSFSQAKGYATEAQAILKAQSDASTEVLDLLKK